MEWHGGTTCSIIVTGTLESLIRLFIIMFYSQQLGVHDISWRLWTRQEKIFTVRMQKMSTFCISIPCWSYSPIHYSSNRPWRFTVSSWQTAVGLKFQTRNLQHTIYQWFCMMGLDSAGVDITICFFLPKDLWLFDQPNVSLVNFGQLFLWVVGTSCLSVTRTFIIIIMLIVLEEIRIKDTKITAPTVWLEIFFWCVHTRFFSGGHHVNDISLSWIFPFPAGSLE